MHAHRGSRRYQKQRIRQQARTIQSCDFFHLLSGPELLDLLEQQLPPHRERLFAPTETLSLFMRQVLSSDASCQAVVNRYAVERLANGLPPCSTSTGAYCKARQRLPLALMESLVRQTGILTAMRASTKWRWQGRAVKLMDGSTVTMPDTPENQARYPQQSTQKPGLGFSIARVSALLCLSTGQSWTQRDGAVLRQERQRTRAVCTPAGQLWLVWDHRRPQHDDGLDILLVLIAQQRVAGRPGRSEPRAVKRRPKSFPLLTEPRRRARARVRRHGHPKKPK